MVDVVGDADMLEIVAAGCNLAPLTEVDVEVVESDGRMGSTSSSHLEKDAIPESADQC